MKTKIIVLIAGVCILAAACQKRKYPDEQVQLEKETIYFNGSVDNAPVTLKIGTDGYYCYSSYRQDADSIYVFTGELKKFNCNPCPVSLKVDLSDYRLRLPGSPVPVDSALRTGSRNFIPALPASSTLKFVSHSNKGVSSLRWDFGNGSSSQDAVTNHEFGQPGPQTVSLTVLTEGNCESVVVNTIFIGGASGFFGCSISANVVQNNLSSFNANIVGGTPPFRYTWNFGDGNISSQAAPDHNYQYAGSYPVKVQITDAENHLCESNYIHIVGNDQSSCAANMSLSYEGSKKNTFLNGVRMQWTDASNVVLRSDSITQPAESYFEVVSSQAYAPNENGEAGRLLTLRFNLLLSNGNRKVWLKSDNTAITVSYK